MALFRCLLEFDAVLEKSMVSIIFHLYRSLDCLCIFFFFLLGYLNDISLSMGGNNFTRKCLSADHCTLVFFSGTEYILSSHKFKYLSIALSHRQSTSLKDGKCIGVSLLRSASYATLWCQTGFREALTTNLSSPFQFFKSEC